MTLIREKLFIQSLLFILCFKFAVAQTDYTQYVNPFVGTGGHGHTFPGAVLPFGMVQLSPDTRVDGSWDGCSGYHYSDSVIYGFSHTHLSGTGVSDYGDILLMPTVGTPVLQALVNGDYKKGYASHFSHKNESASPGFYSVHLDDDKIDCAFTVTQRTGFHKYAFPETSQANLILDLTHRDETLDAYVHVIDSRHIEGYRRSRAWAENQVVYFYIEFQKQMDAFGITRNDSILPNVREAHGKNVKAFFTFTSNKGEVIAAKVALSQTSMDGARYNLRECYSWDFEAIHRDAVAAWNLQLRKIEVKGGSPQQRKVFYTALYHCMIHPSLAGDADGKYLGRDFQVHQSVAGSSYFTVFSLWDTYRALHPLLSIIDQRHTRDFINTFLLQYQQGGRLPVWELSSNETNCMIGYHSVSVIADAAMKGIRFDYPLALQAMVHSAMEDYRGLAAYRRQGYISMEDEGESVSKTLEYAYDDWCVAQMAKLAGNDSIYQKFIERGQYWKNVFDWKRGFMRPRKNGGWVVPFDPYQVSGNFTEANAWQYLFAVPQDIDGLMAMMGGRKDFEEKLDSLFGVSSQTSGMSLPDVAGLIGQYAQGNEPSHHMAYLFDYCGAPWKTQQRVHEIMNMYTDASDGLIGNEDCGQMSAWYVMSAMGFYEVTPGYPQYAMGSPLFDTVRIRLENSKTFTLIAHHDSPADIYISDITLNGVRYDSILISHESIMSGATLQLSMSATPAEGFHPAVDYAPSKEISQHAIAVDPVIESSARVFSNSMKLLISCYDKDEPFFAVNQEKTRDQAFHHFNKYTATSTFDVNAYARNRAGTTSKIVHAHFSKINHPVTVNYLTTYDAQYPGDGSTTLVDNQFGSTNLRDGSWQGWEDGDMKLLIDLGHDTLISKTGAQFLQDQRSWVLMPTKVVFEVSADGKNFSTAGTARTTVSDRDETPTTEIFSVSFTKQPVRYIRITAHNYGVLPRWHRGAGGMAWIFCDEIFVE